MEGLRASWPWDQGDQSDGNPEDQGPVGTWGHLEGSWGHFESILGDLGAILGALGAVLVSPFSSSGLVTKPLAKPSPSQDTPKPYLNSLHFSSRFLLRLGSLLGSSWLPLGLHLGSLLGSILAQLRPKSLPKTIQKHSEKSRRKKIDPRRSWTHLGAILGRLGAPSWAKKRPKPL